MRALIMGYCRPSSLFALALLCSACGVKKVQEHRTLEASSFKNQLSQEHYNAQLITEQFGGTLNGSFFVNDTGEADSSQFESNGLKVKVKVSPGKTDKNGKKGKQKIDVQAQADAVARSTLTVTGGKTTDQKEGSKAVVEENINKSTNRLSLKSWLIIAALSVIALLFLFPWLKRIFKKLTA